MRPACLRGDALELANRFLRASPLANAGAYAGTARAMYGWLPLASFAGALESGCTCFLAEPELFRNVIYRNRLGCLSSEERIRQAIGKTEKRRNGMEPLDGTRKRVKEVHSGGLPERTCRTHCSMATMPNTMPTLCIEALRRTATYEREIVGRR